MTKGFLGAVLVLAFSGSAHAEVVKLECTSVMSGMRFVKHFHLDPEKKTIKCHKNSTSKCADDYVGPHDLTSDDENHYWQHDATSLGKTKRISYELNRTSLTLTWGEEGGLTLQESCKILGPPKI